MREIPAGHTFEMRLRVTPAMTARFFGSEVHPLYSTISVVEHVEYAARQAILPFLEEGEDAVGSAVEIEHRSAAPVGALVRVTARVEEVVGRSILCSVRVDRDGEIVAEGGQRQHVVDRARLLERIERLQRELPEREKEA